MAVPTAELRKTNAYLVRQLGKESTYPCLYCMRRSMPTSPEDPSSGKCFFLDGILDGACSNCILRDGGSHCSRTGTAHSLVHAAEDLRAIRIRCLPAPRNATVRGPRTRAYPQLSFTVEYMARMLESLVYWNYWEGPPLLPSVRFVFLNVRRPDSSPQALARWHRRIETWQGFVHWAGFADRYLLLGPLTLPEPVAASPTTDESEDESMEGCGELISRSFTPAKKQPLTDFYDLL